MLVFRKGKWIQVTVPNTDPMLGTHHKWQLAAAIGTRLARGQAPVTATHAAEADIYASIFPELCILGEQHGRPQNQEK